MQRLQKLLNYPIDFTFWIGIVAGILMMLHVSADVAARTLLNSPVEGTTETAAGYYMVAIAYLPWAWLARNDAHIRVEMFTSFAPKRVVEWLDIAVKVATVAFLAIFVWRTTLRALDQMRAGEVWQAGTSYISIWPSRWVLPVAGGLMALYLVLRIVADVATALRR
jgi:TRAP-type C4-dicarboxylate transport system permease small subunit